MTPEALFPRSAYPIRLEALHWQTRAVVWSVVIEAPEPGKLAEIYIPPLAAQLGHPVAMRMLRADGVEETTEPPEGTMIQ